jgi:hypothetical protein
LPAAAPPPTIARMEGDEAKRDPLQIVVRVALGLVLAAAGGWLAWLLLVRFACRMFAVSN